MPHFYFNIRDGDNYIEDKEGVDLPTPRAALEEAKQAARDLLADRLRHDRTLDQSCFEVNDDLGKCLFTLPIQSVLLKD